MSASHSKDNLLLQLLECDKKSLRLIENVNYEWSVIDFRCRCAYAKSLLDVFQDKERGKNGLDRVLFAIISLGLSQIEEAVDTAVCWLEAIPNERALTDDEEEDLTQLRSLNPYEDIRFEIDGLNTCVWFENNEELYRQYVPAVIREFEYGTGLKIQDCDCGKYYV